MKQINYDPLRSNVSMLGKILGDVIGDAEGQAFLNKIEQIRLLSKSAQAGNTAVSYTHLTLPTTEAV